MPLNLNQNLNLQTSQRLEQTMAPQQLQALEILQASSLELEQKIYQELVQNPLLELQETGAEVLVGDLLPESEDEDESSSDFSEAGASLAEYDENLVEALREDTGAAILDNYLSDSLHRNADADAAKKRRHFFDSLSAEPSLQEQLLEQLREQCGDDAVLWPVCRELVGNLDDSGYLQASDAELCQQCQVDLSQVHRGLRLLQSLEPAGLAPVHCENVFCSELERSRERGSLAWDIVDRHLEDLGRNRLPQIAKAIDADLDEVQEAAERIRQLSPRPGHALTSESAPIVSPDAFIEKNEEGFWGVRLNTSLVPKLVLSKKYVQLLDSPELPAETKKFLKAKLSSAHQLFWALGQRQQTLERISMVLVEMQEEFLEAGDRKLKPMTMSTVAEQLDLHEATISRAIANKYVMTPQGLLSFKHFFSAGYQADDGEELSSRAIKQKIARLIRQEDARKPLSDQKIADLLKTQGVEVARRTVAKYREEEKLPAASLRRQH